MARNTGVGGKPSDYYDGTRPEMLDFVPVDAKTVLEVGCGKGFFGKSIKARQKVEVWGLEIVREVAEEAIKSLDKVIIADIEQDSIDLPRSYFDCVVFNDVLEHLKDPWGVLKSLQVNLSENGCIVASIPNIREFSTIQKLIYHKEWRYIDSGVLDRTHLRFFTRTTIEDMFQSCNYRIVKIKGIHPTGFPWKFKLFNWLMMNYFEDMKYLQFACIAQKNSNSV